jgi:aryl-alcohol dehydrogenase-like predicted oxidoreductase
MQSIAIQDLARGEMKRVSRLGLGCSQIGSFGNRTPTAELRALLRLALDLGVNLFDTADIYGQGDSEREIGRAAAGRRDEIFVITKFGKRFSPAARLLAPLKPVIKPLLQMRGAGLAVASRRAGVMREDFRPERLKAALEASLRRLRFDYVDAVLLHGPPLAVISDPAVAEALSDIRRSGKARHVGVSVETAAELEAAAALSVVTVVQIPFDLAPLTATGNVARRVLQGELTVFAREIIRLQPNLAPTEALRRARRHDQLAGLIIGTNRRDHLQALVAASSG